MYIYIYIYTYIYIYIYIYNTVQQPYKIFQILTELSKHAWNLKDHGLDNNLS